MLVTPHKTHQISKHYSSQIHQVGDQRQNQIEGCKTKTDGTTTSMWGATILESSTKSCLQDRQKRCGPQRAQSSQRKGEGRAECHTHPGSSLFLRLPPWPLCLNRHLNSSSGLWEGEAPAKPSYSVVGGPLAPPVSSSFKISDSDGALSAWHPSRFASNQHRISQRLETTGASQSPTKRLFLSKHC